MTLCICVILPNVSIAMLMAVVLKVIMLIAIVPQHYSATQHKDTKPFV